MLGGLFAQWAGEADSLRGLFLGGGGGCKSYSPGDASGP